MKKAFFPRLIGGAIMLVLSAALLLNCQRNEQAGDVPNPTGTADLTARYMGRETCKECHEKEYNLFQGSDHDMAMDTATEETVLGDFNDVSFTHFGITSRFYRADGKFMVQTEGLEGTMEDYQIDYVFGVSSMYFHGVIFTKGKLKY